MGSTRQREPFAAVWTYEDAADFCALHGWLLSPTASWSCTRKFLGGNCLLLASVKVVMKCHQWSPCLPPIHLTSKCYRQRSCSVCVQSRKILVYLIVVISNPKPCIIMLQCWSCFTLSSFIHVVSRLSSIIIDFTFWWVNTSVNAYWT